MKIQFCLILIIQLVVNDLIAVTRNSTQTDKTINTSLNSSNPDYSPDQEKPNIIIIVTDDQGYGDFGITGNNIIETPNINKFAFESVRFERFYVSPVCAPTRASLLTGRYYLRTGVNGVTHREETMNTEEVTIAELLKSNGYATGCFGKWHNGAEYPFDPVGQGFKEFWGFTGGIIRNYFDTRMKHNNDVVETEGYITDFLTDKAIAFIEENKDQPFFCYIPYNVPHTPIQVPDKLFEKYKAKGLNEYDAGIYAMCETVDQNMNKLMKRINQLGLDEKTVIMFLTDNGPNGKRYNAGMKGTKAHVDEGGVRVPFWVRWKGYYTPGKVVTELTDHIDILPTVMDLCGIGIPDSLKIDGRSLKPLLSESQPVWQERPLFTYYSGKGAVRTNQYRLTINKNGEVALYDMLADPCQLFDIVDQKPEKKSELHKIYQVWLNDVKIDQEVPPVHIGYKENPVVELPTASGDLSGGLKYKNRYGYAYDWAVNWISTKAKFTWDIKIVNNGTYEVFLQYLTPDGNEGSEVVVTIGNKKLINKITEPFLPANYPDRDQVDRGRPPEKNWKDFSWGKVKLDKGNFKLTVQATKIPGDQVGELYALKIRYLE